MQSSPPSGTAARTQSLVIASEGKAEVTQHPMPIAGDVLLGANEVAEFMFGDRKHRRRVYNLAETKRLPIFRIGVNICARKSILLDWIASQERGNTGQVRKDDHVVRR